MKFEKYSLSFLTMVILNLFLSGCASMFASVGASLIENEATAYFKNSSKVIYPKSMDAVWKATISTLRNIGYTPQNAYSKKSDTGREYERILFASSGAEKIGAHVGINIKSISESSTVVEIKVTQSRFFPPQKETAQMINAQIRKQLMEGAS